jgi:hypothetical protein
LEGADSLIDTSKHIFRHKEIISSLYIEMDKYNIREKHIKLTTLKMDYHIFKTSKKNEVNYWNRDRFESSRSIEVEIIRWRHQKMLSHIELISKEIDRRIESNLKRMPIYLEAEIELSLEKHLRDFVVLERLRF